MELETMSLTIPYRLPDKQPNSTGNRIGDTSFNYTSKQPNQVGFIPYIYLPKNSIGKAHEQSIYSKVPLHTLQGKSKSNSTQDQCRVHPKGTALNRIQVRHISSVRGAESSYVPLKSLPLLQTVHTNIPPEALSDFRGYIRITLFEITAVQHRWPAPWPGVQPEETPESCLPGY